MLVCKLKVLRAIHDMTQIELAKKLDIRVPTISEMEKNKTPRISIKILDKICTEYDCQIDDIYKYTPDDNKYLPKREYKKTERFHEYWNNPHTRKKQS